MRVEKDAYYLQIAKDAAARSTCLRRAYGAVIVSNGEIISTGYNGAPRGRENCCDRGCCERKRLGIAPGERYELCRSVHAEANAIISAARRDMLGGTLYLSGILVDENSELATAEPCDMCKRLIINAGIKEVVAKVDGVITHIPVADYVNNEG